MAYAVELTLRAARDLDHLYQIRAAESIPVARWYNGLERAVFSLERFPRRCPVAPESKKTRRSPRHFLYGKKPNVHRVIFEIDERGIVVRVLTIRHGAMDEAHQDEL
jgi:plasmid stabilization system protein ParE